MKTSFRKIWDSSIGKPGDFPMENLAFNAIIVISLLILLWATVVNFAIDLDTLGYLTLGAFFMLLPIYYFSRFKKKFLGAALVFSILSYLLIGITFFFNSGTDGPMLYFLLATFIMILVVTPRSQQHYWFMAHLLTASILFFIEYRFPDTVPYTYPNRYIEYLDIYLSFIFSLIFIWILVNYLRNNYNHEKELAKKRAKELQESSQIIQEQNLELKEFNDEKDRLFSIISHDLRSPISSIKGLLQIMNDESITPDEKKEIENDLLKLTNNTFILLENLLHWSSQKVKGQGHQLRAISLHYSIEETIALLSPSAKAKFLNINVSGAKDIKILGNQEMLSIVIRNLLSNAIKFTPENGRIDIICSENGTLANLIVKDSGLGIPLEKQRNLFNGRQVSSYGTQNEGGAGLGLVLCKEYIQHMNGSIEFESHVNMGTEFRVKLPLFES